MQNETGRSTTGKSIPVSSNMIIKPLVAAFLSYLDEFLVPPPEHAADLSRDRVKDRPAGSCNH
jgi:hypothetical protein